jgi:hypothetical protein
MSERSPFLRHLLGNLRLSAIIIAVGFVAAGLFALIAQEPINWQIPIFLAIGMLLSSAFNAVLDTRRERREQEGGT